MPILGVIASAFASAAASPVLTGLLQWYDASDSSTITKSADRVSAWQNKASGYPYTVVQATSGQQPLWVSAGKNGKDLLRWTNARNDLMALATAFAPGNGATKMTFFVACKITSTLQGGIYVTGRDAGSGGGWMPASVTLTNGKMSYQTGSGGSAVTATSVTTNTSLIHGVNHDIQAVTQKVIYGATTDTTTVTGLTLDVGGGSGGYTPGVGFNILAGAADMDFYEVLFYASTLSGADYTKNIDYLKAKWGI